MGIKFVPFNRRENRRSLAIFFAEEIAHVGALKIARFCGGRSKSPPQPQRIARFWCTHWRQIWRVPGRESGSPELLGSPPTSPEVPRTSPEVFRRLPRRFSHCGTKQQSRGSPEVSRTSPEVPQTSPEVPGLPRRSAPFSGKPDTLS